jgi:hypothetical protein
MKYVGNVGIIRPIRRFRDGLTDTIIEYPDGTIHRGRWGKYTETGFGGTVCPRCGIEYDTEHCRGECETYHFPYIIPTEDLQVHMEDF